MPARLGGDEFAVFLPYCDEDNAQVVGMQICSRIAQSEFRYQQHVYRIGASAGLCALSTLAHDTSEVLSHADQALYKAKALGGNAVVNYAQLILSHSA
jgi:diguanylate cyclase (GGDEF)-like protein